MISPAAVSIAPLVRHDDVSYRYPNGPLVLDSITLSVRPGDFTGLVGPCGSGKTTMLQVLLGMDFRRSAGRQECTAETGR